MTDKGPGEAPAYTAEQTKNLRIGIIHARWNAPIISALVSGARGALLDAGVPATNIVTQTCPGSYELPLAAQRMLAASQTSASGALVSAASDLLGSASDLAGSGAQAHGGGGPGGALDAVIAIGVLIKGSTMHFEYISDAVAHGLMRAQLDAGVPVVLGVLTCLTEEQARTRAGLGKRGADGKAPFAAAPGENTMAGLEAGGAASAEGTHAHEGGEKPVHYAEQGHNHGVDWGKAAVEMAVKRKAWGEGRFI